MDSRLESTLNLEAHVWTLSSVFTVCRERAIKNVNYHHANSGALSDEEVRSFANCVTKHVKAIALFPSVIN
jgi:hypothetical protein